MGEFCARSEPRLLSHKAAKKTEDVPVQVLSVSRTRSRAGARNTQRKAPKTASPDWHEFDSLVSAFLRSSGPRV